ncbi:alkene reductase [Chitinophaga sp. HK235]|uniref:alkene reductase n=1 Tax=Chitinophaga sp. HK235 TaxID=2952571 RepID=UPI001BAC125C|nr:alkene reductase [Chitinophaga sp. HK235]
MNKLLEPYYSPYLNLRNRVVMAPMTRGRADTQSRMATPLMAQYYGQRASAGLIVTEGIAVSPDAVGGPNIPGIYTPEQVKAWRQVTTQVHRHNGKIFAQLWHVGRVSHPNLLDGRLPLSPSAIDPNCGVYTVKGYTQTVVPREMSTANIRQTVQDFAQAAIHAVEAGFDGVEIHAANGYLFHQFFAKCSNQRTDAYGGSIENRSRFLFEVLDAIGEGIPLSHVGVRISPTWNNAFGIVTDNETIPLFDYLSSQLNKYDLAYLHLAGFPEPGLSIPASVQIRAVAQRFRQLYKGTYIANRGFNQETANEIIAAGIADMVSFGELFIANPDLVERFSSQAPLNTLDRATSYLSGEKGYTDYPRLTE